MTHIQLDLVHTKIGTNSTKLLANGRYKEWLKIEGYLISFNLWLQEKVVRRKRYSNNSHMSLWTNSSVEIKFVIGLDPMDLNAQ